MNGKFERETEREIEQIKALVSSENYAEAAALCEKICARGSVVDARVWHILGAIHLHNNNVVQAETCIKQALTLAPGLGASHYNLAIVLQRQGKLEEAEERLQRALKTRPADATLFNELGNVYRLTGQNNRAVVAYRQAISLVPEFRDAHFNLGNTFLELCDRFSALGCMRAAYACDSRFVKAKAIEAKILEMQGDIEGAWKCLEPLLDAGTFEPAFADAFAVVGRHLGKEQQAIDILKAVVQDDKISKGELSRLYFLLGSLQERLHQYDTAFGSYTKGNTLVEVPDNSMKLIQDMRDFRHVPPKYIFKPGAQPKLNDEVLVFIVGMPRSGTSLVEQILSAHSQVATGGELGYMKQLVQEVIPHLSLSNNRAGDLDQKAVEQYARRYISRMEANFGPASRITDKTNHNFMYLEFITKIFPRAHIIHCRRSPLDTCTSCYCRHFSGADFSYTNNLVPLGKVYREYQLLMNYWENDLAIPVLDVPYEAVVEDIELWARRIVDYCGLKWEKKCLEFYKKKRQVFTMSYNQVRQPVYKSSINKWMHFEEHLGPLKQILNEPSKRRYQ